MRPARLLAVLALAVAPIAACADSDELDTPTPSDSPDSSPDDDGVGELVEYDDLSQQHLPGEIDYPQSPAVGGDHNSQWQDCGVYDQPLVEEFVVHSLEHGAVWVTYRPDVNAAVRAAAEELAGGSGYVLVSPYEEQSAAVVLTAWGVQQTFDDPTAAEAGDFVSTYAQGPQTPEPGAPCSGARSESGQEAEDVLVPPPGDPAR